MQAELSTHLDINSACAWGEKCAITLLAMTDEALEALLRKLRANVDADAFAASGLSSMLQASDSLARRKAAVDRALDRTMAITARIEAAARPKAKRGKA